MPIWKVSYNLYLAGGRQMSSWSKVRAESAAAAIHRVQRDTNVVKATCKATQIDGWED